MSQSVTYPNILLLGVDNVRRKLDLPMLDETDRIEHRAWCTSQPGVSLITIIASWLQQNILPKYNSVGFYQKGSFTAGFTPTV